MQLQLPTVITYSSSSFLAPVAPYLMEFISSCFAGPVVESSVAGDILGLTNLKVTKCSILWHIWHFLVEQHLSWLKWCTLSSAFASLPLNWSAPSLYSIQQYLLVDFPCQLSFLLFEVSGKVLFVGLLSIDAQVNIKCLQGFFIFISNLSSSTSSSGPGSCKVLNNSCSSIPVQCKNKPFFLSTVSNSFCHYVVIKGLWPIFSLKCYRGYGALAVTWQNSTEFITCCCHVDFRKGTGSPYPQCCIRPQLCLLWTVHLS